MGSGIAQVVAQSGRGVVVVDTDKGRLRAGRAVVDASLERGAQSGKTTDQQRHDILSRIRETTQLSEIGEVGLVIEAVVEERPVKRAVLTAIGDIARRDAVLVTTTSALSVTELATAVPAPERFAGLHFLSPAQLTGMVEVVRALQTDEAVLAGLIRFCVGIGKEPVEVKDRPGFLLNRLLMPYLNAVVQAYDDGLATAEDLDLAIEHGLGHPIGPLELLDKIGLDAYHHTTTSAYERTLDPQFAPPPLLSSMVTAGWLGDKVGRGFRSTRPATQTTEEAR
jgi:3-hydroxybutyryl-CoA dehydrogenase